MFDAGPVPELVVTGAGRDQCADYVLGNMLGLERALAADAYDKAAGVAWEGVALGLDRATFAADLGDMHVKYGIAQGEKSDAQLVRGIESRAAGRRVPESGIGPATTGHGVRSPP